MSIYVFKDNYIIMPIDFSNMDTVISVRVNKEVKEYAKEVANSAGLTLSSVYTLSENYYK